MPGSLTSGSHWSRWRGKRSRHSRHMRNPQFYVSGKRPIPRCGGRDWSLYLTIRVKLVKRRQNNCNICPLDNFSDFLNWILQYPKNAWRSRIHVNLGLTHWDSKIGHRRFRSMACRLFGTKPLSEAMLGYCQFDPYEQTWVKSWSKFKPFRGTKCI